MFSFVSKKLNLVLMLMVSVVSLSMVWIIDSSAEGLLSQENNSLPVVTLKEASDLVADGNIASKKQIPVLLFFSMKHCPYCIEVEEDYLKPILRNSEYDNKVIIRKVRIDSIAELRDFNGKVRFADDFGDDYNVYMVPTVMLVNSHGKKTAPKIIGIANSHYYSAELDDAIDASTQKMRTIAKR